MKDWELHMAENHGGSFPLSQLPSLARVSQRSMLQPLACPLCGYAVDHPHSTLDGHIAKHLHGFALSCLPWGTGGNEMESAVAISAETPGSRESYDIGAEDGEYPDHIVSEADTPRRIYLCLKAAGLDAAHRNQSPWHDEGQEWILEIEQLL
jgi:hypothetical protein